MNTEINKKQVCFSVLSAHLVVDGEDRSFSLPRKELLNLMHDALLEAGIDRLDIKPNLATSYYQMGRMEFITQKGAYRHHKTGPMANVDKEDEEPEVIIPEGSQWQAKREDTIEYFKNRQGATAFTTKNGPREEWEVTKLAQA